METRFPHSPWLADALFSAGNMYLLKRDYPTAIQYYSDLAARFPSDKNAAAAHWRSGWLSYRLGLYADAERIFDEQIRSIRPPWKRSPRSTGVGASMRRRTTIPRWPRPTIARSSALTSTFSMRRWRASGWRRWAARSRRRDPQLDRFQPAPQPHLVDTFPEDSPHLAKARLLANAGLE